ncbi:thyrotropin-releasing hormone receptor-like [Paramacrobiotus metropolitanus]|uniref:thyrotropin-releasing hormone receptor-like n=1 Tax=Paramacrobiotus metropolitanus TaxID=2943436 RepID=UPI002445DE35|nr:thyrotropin-releasing hormone receptor-like [Paramacrobiotus metropolitanus]
MTFHNTSNETIVQSNSQYAAWIMIPVTLTTLTANILLILVYIKFGRLQTPFAVYIVSLATGDLAQTLTVHIHSIFTLMSIWPLGQPFCTFILYTCWVFLSFSYHMHVLICTNRVWAVMFPTHYRMYHNKKVALCLVLGMLLYLNAWTLPGFVIHVLYYSGSDGSPLCIPSYPHELAWSNPNYVAMYLVPEALVLVMYPVILFKIRGKIKFRMNILPSLRSSQHNTSGSLNTGNDKKHHSSAPRPHFAMLTALVMVAVMCWTPINTAYVLVYFQGILLYSLMTPCTVVFFLDALLNPMIFLIASREWRDALKKLFHC